jgi:site-specific DNA-methyltransferase (adenine-specific)
METNVILQGDALTELKKLPDESIDCCMSSPPYWSLRNYNVEGQLGLEPTFQEYINKLCDIYDQVFRVLKKSGTCWVNLGDTYNNSGWAGDKPNKFDHDPKDKKDGLAGRGGQLGYSDKCLCMIPFRFAIEMVNRGWILRNDCVWYKRNSMPSSVRDRFCNKWEHVFFFVKNKKYFFDLDAVRKPYKETSLERFKRGVTDSSAFNYRVREACKGTLHAEFGEMYKASPEEIESYGSPRAREFRQGRKANNHELNNRNFMPTKNSEREFNGRWGNDGKGMAMPEKWNNPKGGNPGDHWDITTKGHPFAHFAVYPEEICETPIKAGCPEFVCNKCGKAREKIIEREQSPKEVFTETKKTEECMRLSGSEIKGCGQKLQNWRNEHPDKFLGYSDCGCNAGFSGGIVLDPFFGSGTTGLVALKQNKNFIGIELNESYIKIANERLKPYLEQVRLAI